MVRGAGFKPVGGESHSSSILPAERGVLGSSPEGGEIFEVENEFFSSEKPPANDPAGKSCRILESAPPFESSNICELHELCLARALERASYEKFFI
jgi:hypothetical protein